MSSQSENLQQNTQHFNRMIREIEEIDPENILPLVPGSGLHQFITRPDSETSDQG